MPGSSSARSDAFRAQERIGAPSQTTQLGLHATGVSWRGASQPRPSFPRLVESVARIRAPLVQRFRLLRVVGTRRDFSPQSLTGDRTVIDGWEQHDQEIQIAVTATKKETNQ